MLLDVAFCELWCYSPVQMCLELLLRYLKFARCICPTNQLLPSKGYRAHGLRVIITLLHMLFFLVLPPLSKILCFSLSTATLKLKLPCGAIELLILLSMRFMMLLTQRQLASDFTIHEVYDAANPKAIVMLVVGSLMKTMVIILSMKNMGIQLCACFFFVLDIKITYLSWRSLLSSSLHQADNDSPSHKGVGTTWMVVMIDQQRSPGACIKGSNWLPSTNLR